MTESERREARRLMRLQELLKDSTTKMAYDYAQKKAQENERWRQILDAWGPNGYVPPEVKNPQPRPMTEEEKRIDDLVRNFG